MKKREAELRSLFTKELHKQLPHFIVLLHYSNAAPDRAIIGNGSVSYLEFKHGTPDFNSPDNQEIMCQRIAQQGFCRYVVWQERDNKKRTLIVTPDNIRDRQGWSLNAEASCEGFDMKWLVWYLRSVHEVVDCDNDVGRVCYKLFPQDPASWCEGCREARQP